MPEGGGRYAVEPWEFAPPVSGVDLIVTSLTASPVSPNAGDAVTFTMTVKNQGTAPVLAGRGAGLNIGVGVYFDGAVPPSVPPTYTNWDGGLAAGVSFTQNTVQGWAAGGTWVATEGTHTVTAIVNDQNLVTESNALNNSFSMTLVVAPAVTPPPPSGQYFVSTSDWNTAIPGGRTYTDVAELHFGGWLNTASYGVSLTIASPSDPLTTIRVPNGSWGWLVDSYTLRCPIDAAPAAGTDGAICILDPTTNTAYDFWQFVRDSPGATTCSASAGAHSNYVTGTGWSQTFNINGTAQGAGIHAVGSSLLAGLIVGNELTAGIHHTLALATRYDLTQAWPNFVGEAISADGSGSPLLEGSRLGIPAATAMPGGLNTQEQNLWTACKTYGAFIIDVTGGTQSIQFWGDPNSIPQADVDALLHPPNYNTVGMNAISTALRVVT